MRVQVSSSTGTPFALLITLLAVFVSGCETQILMNPVAQDSAKVQHKAAVITHGKNDGKSKRGNHSPYVVFGKRYEVLPNSLGYREIGIASWYGKKFHGRLTSNGEVYDMYQLSAAHKSLPLPTQVKVTNLDNGKSVVVRVNDRGPFHDDRVIDLSYQTALALGFANKGTAPVVVEAVDLINYPSLHKSKSKAFYLQVGAFSRLEGASSLKQKIEILMRGHDIQGVDVNVLQSELESTILHKVWLGPIATQINRNALMMLMQQAKLGKAIQVEIQ